MTNPHTPPTWTRLSIKKAISILSVILLLGAVLVFRYYVDREAEKRYQTKPDTGITTLEDADSVMRLGFYTPE